MTVRSTYHALYLANSEKRADAKEDMKDGLAAHSANVNENYNQTMKQIEENRKAREEASFWTTLGTIICPLVGTAIGGAIGQATGDDNKKAATQAEKDGKIADFYGNRAFDQVDKSGQALEAARKELKNTADFVRELQAGDPKLAPV